MDKYSIFLPEKAGDYEEEWRQCLNNICSSDSLDLKLVKLNIFADISDSVELRNFIKSIKRSLISVFGEMIPAFSVTPHPPEKPWSVIVEATFVKFNPSEIYKREINSVPYIVRLSESSKEIWAGGVGSGIFNGKTKEAARDAFLHMKDILSAEGMSFNHIVRQWNYIGNILWVEDNIQNYQIFNEIRNENYKKFRTVKGYPAATGVGMKFFGVSLDFYAVKGDKDIDIVPIDNPDQVNPYSYGQKVLRGLPSSGKGKNQPPQFERALLLKTGRDAILFVSGTASIIGEETIGLGDVDRQTIVTIDNINKLTDISRIKSISKFSDYNSLTINSLRVYIRNQYDFPSVKKICRDAFGEIPAVFIEADICRDDLLVEIEAEYTLNQVSSL